MTGLQRRAIVRGLVWMPGSDRRACGSCGRGPCGHSKDGNRQYSMPAAFAASAWPRLVRDAAQTASDVSDVVPRRHVAVTGTIRQGHGCRDRGRPAVASRSDARARAGPQPSHARRANRAGDSRHGAPRCLRLHPVLRLHESIRVRRSGKRAERVGAARRDRPGPDRVTAGPNASRSLARSGNPLLAKMGRSRWSPSSLELVEDRAK